jgi:hypothetical protein
MVVTEKFTTELNGIEEIAVNLYQLSSLVGFFLGSIMFLAGIKALTAYSKNPNDPRNTLGSVLIMMIGASMLWSLQNTISLATNTLSNNSHCFVLSESETINHNAGDCFDAKNSEITEDLRTELEAKGKTEALSKLLAKMNVYFKVLQAIGLIYFIKGIYLLKTIAQGSGNTTYGQVLIILISSSLVLDLPNTLQMIVNTAKEITSL